MSQTVLLLEQQPEIALVCANALRAGGFCVSTSSEEEQFLKTVESGPPDLAVLGLRYSGPEGLEVLRRLRQSSNCLVLLTCTQASESERILGFEQGGDDYLMKPFSTRELLSRVRALMRRLEWQDGGSGRHRFARCGELCLDLDGKTICLGQGQQPLTSSEFSILRRMMWAPTKVFSRDELLSPPYRKRGESLRAVDMHVANLRRKIKTALPGYNALVAVRGVGYRLKV